MMEEVHVDEKWFYIIELMGKYYLLPEEEEPLRQAKSKRYILKVMFLCAIARPRWDTHKKQWWDGKIGMWLESSKSETESESEAGKAGSDGKELVNEEFVNDFSQRVMNVESESEYSYVDVKSDGSNKSDSDISSSDNSKSSNETDDSNSDS